MNKTRPQTIERPQSNLFEHTEKEDAFQVKSIGAMLA